MDWQPIASAPKDGDVLDLWVKGDMLLPTGWRETPCRWGVPSDGWTDPECWLVLAHGDGKWVPLESEPTHWMRVGAPT